MIQLDLSGVLVPTTTPFDPVTGELDLVGFRANLRSLLDHPVRGILVGGSTGEAVLLDEEERGRLLEGARDVIPHDRILLAGTGAESTRSTIHLCAMAADSGVDAVLVQPPAFYRGAMNDRALTIHYAAVAEASSVPVILYQVPLRLSTLEFATSLVSELSRIDNVVAIKDSRGSLELLGELITATPEVFQVLVGSGAAFYGALSLGAVGGILAVANLDPSASAEIHTEVCAGNSAEAGRIQERIGPLHTGVVGGLGVPGIKAGLDMLGLRGGPPRQPLHPLDDNGRAAVAGFLEKADLLVTT